MFTTLFGLTLLLATLDTRLLDTYGGEGEGEGETCNTRANQPLERLVPNMI